MHSTKWVVMDHGSNSSSGSSCNFEFGLMGRVKALDLVQARLFLTLNHWCHPPCQEEGEKNKIFHCKKFHVLELNDLDLEGFLATPPFTTRSNMKGVSVYQKCT